MSVTMAKSDGVTVLTLTSDPNSLCPPLCQILKGLFYSPVCCSVSQHLKRVQKTNQSVLGALHIMVGLLNIGLGVILCLSRGGSGWQMDFTMFPFWLGGLFIWFGVMSILSEKCPSPFLVILNVMANLTGVAFAIAAIVLYSINLGGIWFGWICDDYESGYIYPEGSTPFAKNWMEKCWEVKAMILVSMLTRSINAVLIVLSVLELCVSVSSAVLGIKALWCGEKRENQVTNDPEQYKALLEEVTTNSTG
uniref:Uncharacterized protein n=1 Tax=Mola mola TaxID=94237 RepID=A0A3Q3WVP0_MOLML